MLSKSETIGTASHLFSPINKKLKIYIRKKNAGVRSIPSITPRFSSKTHKKNALEVASYQSASCSNDHLKSAIDSMLLMRHIPASVVVNYDMEIIEVRGATESYLRVPTGKPSTNILKLIRPELAYELRNVIQTSIKTKETVRKSGLEIMMNKELFSVNLEVEPLTVEGEEPLLVILFKEQQRVEILNLKDKNNVTLKNSRLRKLEDELASSRADMLVAIHDHEATIEELQSANEEVVSNNEELRTLNEELETSKEEIESTNEELLNAYQKLQLHSDQVEKLNKYSETIIGTIHNPMLVLDKDLVIKSANSTFCKRFQVTDKVEGRKLYTLNNYQWKIPQLISLLEELISKKKPLFNFEFTHTFKKTGKKILLLNAQLTKKDNNEQLIVLVMEDITERAILRNKEQKLLLELQSANNALKELNTELTSFNHVAGHDLQEPLRKIKTFINLILTEEKQGISETVSNYFQRIKHSADKMQLLIENLLAYSRMSYKEKKLEKIDISDVVEEVKNEFEQKIKETNAQIEVKSTLEIRVITFQFYQLMSNLIGNSLKYVNPKHAPHITIKSKLVKGKKLKYEELLPDSLYCHISVSDNGIGFPSKYSERIFNLFERLHEKDKYEGTGIGLAICRKVVKNHNGFISATSEKDRGSTFDIYIPYEK
jgi:two-component system CheB/CheR fusion protein